MQSQTLKSKVAKGAVWTLLEKLSTQVVGFVVSMILARLLTPNDYGTVALTGIFFAVAGALVDGGFGGALIQKKDADDLDFNSVFYMNLGLSFLAYITLFFAAPLIADFYKTPELVVIIRIAAVSLIFNAINAIQNAELTKKLLFNLSFRVSLITCCTSAICGVTLACLGYGVWALVWSSLISGLMGVIARWFIIAWRPRLMFSWTRLKPLFSFGWKMAIANVIATFFGHLNSLIIGRFYTRSDLAFVNKGNALPYLAMSQIDETIGRVSFPALVLLQNDKAKLRNAMRQMIRSSTFLVFPLMLGIAVCSYSIIRLLFGPQWTSATPYMILACFSFALWPFHTINLKGIVALRRSDVFLKLEIIKKVSALVVLLSTFRLGILPWMTISTFVLGPLGVIINIWPNRKLLNYTITMQLYDVMPTAIVCVVEVVVMYGIGVVADGVKLMLGIVDTGTGLMMYLGVKLMLQFLLGGIVFFWIAYAFRLKSMGECVRMGVGVLRGRWARIMTSLESRFST